MHRLKRIKTAKYLALIDKFYRRAHRVFSPKWEFHIGPTISLAAIIERRFAVGARSKLLRRAA